MAEMAIFMQDQEGERIEMTAKLPQRGDVVVVHETGWQWGAGEIGNPLFALVVVPDAVPQDLASFLSPEVAQPGMEDETWANTNNTRQYRGFKIDVDSYVPAGGGEPGLRAGATTIVTLDEVMGLKVQKDPIPDPKVIGDSGLVFG